MLKSTIGFPKRSFHGFPAGGRFEFPGESLEHFPIFFLRGLAPKEGGDSEFRVSPFCVRLQNGDRICSAAALPTCRMTDCAVHSAVHSALQGPPADQ